MDEYVTRSRVTMCQAGFLWETLRADCKDSKICMHSIYLTQINSKEIYFTTKSNDGFQM